LFLPSRDKSFEVIAGTSHGTLTLEFRRILCIVALFGTTPLAVVTADAFAEG
jgi:hypothetical protein